MAITYPPQIEPISQRNNLVSKIWYDWFYRIGAIIKAATDSITGTAGTIPKLKSPYGLEDSLISESGTVVSVNGSLNVSTAVNANADTDKFLVLDTTGNIDYRIGSEVASDIGASTIGHVHDGDTLQIDGINSNGGAFPFNTTGAVAFNQNVDVDGNEIILNRAGDIKLRPDVHSIIFTSDTFDRFEMGDDGIIFYVGNLYLNNQSMFIDVDKDSSISASADDVISIKTDLTERVSISNTAILIKTDTVKRGVDSSVIEAVIPAKTVADSTLTDVFRITTINETGSTDGGAYTVEVTAMIMHACTADTTNCALKTFKGIFAHINTGGGESYATAVSEVWESSSVASSAASRDIGTVTMALNLASNTVTDIRFLVDGTGSGVSTLSVKCFVRVIYHGYTTEPVITAL